MASYHIQYVFHFNDGKTKVFDIDLKNPVKPKATEEEPLPDWARLEHRQCSHCPLSAKEHTYCPLAARLVEPVNCSLDRYSFDKVKVEINSENREIRLETSVQKAISSLMGLLIPTSGCPHTAFFKPMAFFHLPLASMEETMFRAASMYLLSRYFVKQSGGDASLELDGLQKIYQNIHLVNHYISKRLRDMKCKDAPINAMIILDMLSQMLTYYVDETVTEFEDLFEAYFKPEPVAVDAGDD